MLDCIIHFFAFFFFFINLKNLMCAGVRVPDVMLLMVSLSSTVCSYCIIYPAQDLVIIVCRDSVFGLYLRSTITKSMKNLKCLDRSQEVSFFYLIFLFNPILIYIFQYTKIHISSLQKESEQREREDCHFLSFLFFLTQVI